MPRSIKLSGFYHHENVIKRNLIISIVTVDEILTLETAVKHLKQFAVTDSYCLRDEGRILFALLEGNWGKHVREICHERGELPSGVNELVTKFKDVWESRRYIRVDQLLEKAFCVADIIVEIIYGHESYYLGKMKQFLQLAIERRYYNTEWAKATSELLLGDLL